MTRQEFAKAIHVLETAMNKTLTPEQIEVWYKCLSDLTAEQLQQAVVNYLREGDDWPSIAKLRRFAGVANNLDAETRAERAWLAVRDAIKGKGGYRSISFDDALTNAAVRSLGGWEQVSGTASDQIQWLHRDFLKAYRAFLATGVSGEMCRPLPGITDTTNGLTGEDGFNEPVVIPCGLPAPPANKIAGPVETPKSLPNAVAGFLPNLKPVEIQPPERKETQRAERDRDSEIERLAAWKAS